MTAQEAKLVQNSNNSERINTLLDWLLQAIYDTALTGANHVSVPADDSTIINAIPEERKEVFRVLEEELGYTVKTNPLNNFYKIISWE